MFGLINNKYASLGNEKYAIKGFDTESLRNIFKSFNKNVMNKINYKSNISFSAKFKNPVETLKELERKGTDRVQP